MSEDWVADTIAAKSDQLNADDLITGPIDVKVMNVKQGSQDQPVIIEIDGGRQPYKPCKNMRRLLVSAWGKTASGWHGKQMRLYRDAEVKWAGQKVGGIRISHLSHIDKPIEMPITVTRGNRVMVKIHPLKVEKKGKNEDVSTRVTRAINALAECDSEEKYEQFKCLIDTELLPNCSKGQESQLLAALKKAERRLGGGDEDGLD